MLRNKNKAVKIMRIIKIKETGTFEFAKEIMEEIMLSSLYLQFVTVTDMVQILEMWCGKKKQLKLI